VSPRAVFGLGGLAAAILASVLAASAGLGGCGSDRSTAGSGRPGRGAQGEAGGPSVRVAVARRPAVWLAGLGDLTVLSLDDGKILLETELPGRVAVREVEGTVDVGGRVRGGALAVVRRDVRAPFEVAHDETGGNPGRYRGNVELRVRSGEVEVVNVLSLEEYLLGVVGAEMPALYPMAALESQAIASRSYALFALRQRGGDARPLGADQGFQVYRGVRVEHDRVRRAVAATRGEVLTYRGRLFRTYFHSTCGGQTVVASGVFAEPDIPPLSGARCGGCEGSRYHRWTSTLSPALLQAAVARGRPTSLQSTGRPTGLSIAERGDDGRALRLLVEHTRGAFHWRVGPFRRAVEALRPGTIRSTWLRIDGLDGAGWRVRGSGWGHGVGMCQVGARGLSRQGLSAGDILARYYPGSERETVY